MKKYLLISLIVLMIISAFTACDETPENISTNAPRTPDTTQKQTIRTEETTPVKDTPTGTPTINPTSTITPTATPDITKVVPIFSKQAGFYTNPFKLTLQTGDSYKGMNLKIRYTLNGEVPTLNSITYNDGIQIQNGVYTIRAACFDASNKIVGKIESCTYINDSSYKTAVVSIIIEPKYLNRMTSNPLLSGVESERPAHIEMYEGNGKQALSQDAGIRIFGGSSRALPQKSFKIYGRNSKFYDENYGSGIAGTNYNTKGFFDYPIFPGRLVKSGVNAGKELNKYDSFILRNGGNDSMLHTSADPYRPTMIRDGVVHRLAAKVAPHVDAMDYRPAVVFINGKYYGILNLREDPSNEYIRNVYDIQDKDNIAIIKSEIETTKKCEYPWQHSWADCRFCNVWFYYETDNSPDGSDTELNQFIKLCKNAIAGKVSYDEVAAKIDMTNFMEYIAFEMFIANTDWPHNNVRLWRYTGTADKGRVPEADGKWRFMLKDMDFSLGRYLSPQILPELYTWADRDVFEYVLQNYKPNLRDDYGNYPDSLYIQGLLNFCLNNQKFKNDFISYCNDLVSSKATASVLKQEINKAAEEVRQEMPSHIDRWHSYIQSSYYNWNASVEEMNNWADLRCNYFKQFLDSAMRE